MSARSFALATLVLVAPVGCTIGDDEPAPPPPPANAAPSLAPLEVADWPPMGAASTIAGRCTDDRGLVSVVAHFASVRRRSVSGADADVFFTGEELGEGMGTLRMICCDANQVCAERQIRDLLIDLTPPEIETDRLVASPLVDGLEGEIGVWVRDAWVLGSVELSFGGKVLRHELPKAYPATVGREWDVTRVGFDAKQLPLGAGKAVVIARDAAGNSVTKEIPIRVDGEAPKVAILAPSAGAVAADGRFTLRVSASDGDNPVPPAIDVLVGGARIAELSGPLAELVVDTTNLPPGPTEVVAVARDDAGNSSARATVRVDVP